MSLPYLFMRLSLMVTEPVASLLSALAIELGGIRRSEEQVRQLLQERDAAHHVLVQAVERLLGELGVDVGTTLVERVGSVSEGVREQSLELACSVVHKVVAMFLSHYPKMERGPLSGGWAPGYEDQEYVDIETESAAFADSVADAAMKDLGLKADE